MRWADANEVVEGLRHSKLLYLPALSARRGFSSTRVEHLLASLRAHCPEREDYLEVGTLEGRTLEAAASAGVGHCIGIDPGAKYGSGMLDIGPDVKMILSRWQEVTAEALPRPIGVAFYDGDHSAKQTAEFLAWVTQYLADDAVCVVDDWDRGEVRAGVFAAIEADPRWRLLREMPEYTQGPDFAPPNHFGYYYGVAVLGFRREETTK